MYDKKKETSETPEDPEVEPEVEESKEDEETAPDPEVTVEDLLVKLKHLVTVDATDGKVTVDVLEYAKEDKPDRIVVKAIPLEAQEFRIWTVNGNNYSTNPEIEIPVNGPLAIVAHFSVKTEE